MCPGGSSQRVIGVPVLAYEGTGAPGYAEGSGVPEFDLGADIEGFEGVQENDVVQPAPGSSCNTMYLFNQTQNVFFDGVGP